MKNRILITLMITIISFTTAACGSEVPDTNEVSEQEKEVVENTTVDNTDELVDDVYLESEDDTAVRDGSRENPYRFGEEIIVKNIDRSYKDSGVNEGYTLKITIDEAWPEGNSGDAVDNVPVFKYHFTLINDEQVEDTPATGLFKVGLICDPYEGGHITKYDGCTERSIVPGTEYSAIVYASEKVYEVTPEYVRIEVSPNTDNTHQKIFVEFPKTDDVEGGVSQTAEEANQSFLVEELGLSESRAEGASKILVNAGCGILVECKDRIDGEHAYQITLVDEKGKEYMTSFGNDGFIGPIKDAEGNYLYSPID